MHLIAAGRFKDVCLKMLDEVAANRTPVVITKRGKRVAQFLPYVASDSVRSLAGSIFRETGDPTVPVSKWDAERDARGS